MGLKLRVFSFFLLIKITAVRQVHMSVLLLLSEREDKTCVKCHMAHKNPGHIGFVLVLHAWSAKTWRPPNWAHGWQHHYLRQYMRSGISGSNFIKNKIILSPRNLRRIVHLKSGWSPKFCINHNFDILIFYIKKEFKKHTFQLIIFNGYAVGQVLNCQAFVKSSSDFLRTS